LKKSKSFTTDSNFKSLTKKSLETNYAKFNAFFSKFKNKKLIARLFLTPIPHRNKKNKSVFSVADFKKTRRLLKTYMTRKTKQKIVRLQLRKRRRELAKEKDEYKKQVLICIFVN
jgi:flagellar biosynthesis protein FliP